MIILLNTYPVLNRDTYNSCAYILLETIRGIGLKGTDMATAQVGTIRLKLLKLKPSFSATPVGSNSSFPAPIPTRISLLLSAKN